MQSPCYASCALCTGFLYTTSDEACVLQKCDECHYHVECLRQIIIEKTKGNITKAERKHMCIKCPEPDDKNEI